MKKFLLIICTLLTFQLIGQNQTGKLKLYDNDSIVTGFRYLKNDSSICYSVIDTISQREIFWYVDKMPFFGKTNTDLIEYIQTNLKYPNIQSDIEGTVYLRVIVEPDGKLSNIKVLRGMDPLIDKEAIAVITDMPVWNAGECSGTKVAVFTIIPVHFILY